MVTGIGSFPWLAESILEQRLSMISIAFMVLQRSQNLLEVEIARERCRLRPWICSETSKIEMLGNLHGFISAQPEALGPDLQELDGVETLWSLLCKPGLANR